MRKKSVDQKKKTWQGS